MRSSFATARAVKSAAGAKLRSSRRRSANSACLASDMPEILPRQRGKARAHRRDQLRVRQRSVFQERAVVFDGGSAIAGFVGDDGEVVVRAGAQGIDRNRASEQVARFGRTSSGFL